MSGVRQDETQLEELRKSSSASSSSSSSSSSPSLSSTSNSISLIKLDELSSFGATKQARLPALIKLNPLADQNSRQQPEQQQPIGSNSMPDFSGSQLEKMAVTTDHPVSGEPHQQSLPVHLEQGAIDNKENTSTTASEKQATGDKAAAGPAVNQDDSVDGFQVVDMEQMSMADDAQMIGPSLPQQADLSNISSSATAINNNNNNKDDGNMNNGSKTQHLSTSEQIDKSLAAASLLNRDQQYASHLGDSLIEMIINLRNENQSLVKALEVNNSYVKERLSEFKRCQEESKRREIQFQVDKAELEHQLRKVQRQNTVLSERLKSMETKLKDMKLEVSESLVAAHSSKASSIRDEDNLYPQLDDTQDESFGNSALRQEAPTTMQVDATSGELYNDGDHQSNASEPAGGSRPMETDQLLNQTSAKEVAGMSKEELSKRFDARKADFFSLDDPMKQCDQLEQQLNDIGKRDYEICLLQQQLNIYRQDFRLERMAKLEAKIQIEKLKNEIDRLCLDRAQATRRMGNSNDNNNDDDDDEQDERQRYGPTPATAAADGLIGKLGHHLSRKALKSAAKAAKYASKQAHLEEKAAAALARAAAAKAQAASHFMPQAGPTQAADVGATSSSSDQEAHGPHGGGEPLPPHLHPHPPPPHHHSRRHHHHRAHHHHHHAPPHHRGPARGLRGEIVSDLMSTANKAMLTGYNLASTTINSALDKLSQYEQQQQQQAAAQAAANATNRPRGSGAPTSSAAASSKPSAPPMELHPSVD